MSGDIAIIGGTGFLERPLMESARSTRVRTRHGTVTLFDAGGFWFVQRHHGNLPPRSINYRGYIEALEKKGVDMIISVNSVGSLKREIEPGTLVVVDDFFCPWDIPTFFTREVRHAVPVVSERVRRMLIDACKREGVRHVDRGVYVQALGPRFETRSEISFFSMVGDVVGMTFASEATLANEKGIEIGALCTVDNYANGISPEPVSYELVRQRARENAEKAERVIARALGL